jgi:transposase
MPPNEAARRLLTTPATVRLWRIRFLQLGPDGLLSDAPGRGRKPSLDHDARQTLLLSNPRSVRALAADLGVSAATVSRWRKRLHASADAISKKVRGVKN